MKDENKEYEKIYAPVKYVVMKRITDGEPKIFVIPSDDNKTIKKYKSAGFSIAFRFKAKEPLEDGSYSVNVKDDKWKWR